MPKISRIIVPLALTLSLSAAAFADGNPACNPDPGIMQSPPCSSAQLPDDASLTPTSQPAPQNTEPEISLSDVTLDIVQTLLTIF